MILAIDPGPAESGWIVFDGQRVVWSGVAKNAGVLEVVQRWASDQSMTLAIEMFEARGMPLGRESIQTILWAGRFMQAWRNPDAVRLIERRQVKSELCGSGRAKDANVRAALLERVGPRGTKQDPGPTYGVKSHAWAALAVAVVVMEGRA